jgi:hypothetical protein
MALGGIGPGKYDKHLNQYYYISLYNLQGTGQAADYWTFGESHE